MTLETEMVQESEALHAEVRAFGRAALEPVTEEDPREARDARFEALALAIASFQARHSPGHRRLREARGEATHSSALPALPVEAFRLARVAVHAADRDRAAFVTSGTTSSERGIHYFRTLDTYRTLSLAFARRALLTGDAQRHVVVALAPPPTEPESSSLGFMMRALMEELDGRALRVNPEGAGFDARARERWLVGNDGVDVAGLRRAALVAQERQEPLLVLATSFALVALLEALGGGTLPAPRRTVVMQTGGFKGRVRAVDPKRLREDVARAFRVSPDQVVGEYGMTELSSQLWEGCLPGAALTGPRGVYLPPPWLRVEAVHPVTRAPLPEGDVGVARFVDLANVDSALVVVSRDRVRRVGAGFELLGREDRAPARGCSLAVEGLLGWA